MSPFLLSVDVSKMLDEWHKESGSTLSTQACLSKKIRLIWYFHTSNKYEVITHWNMRPPNDTVFGGARSPTTLLVVPVDISVVAPEVMSAVKVVPFPSARLTVSFSLAPVICCTVDCSTDVWFVSTVDIIIVPLFVLLSSPSLVSCNVACISVDGSTISLEDVKGSVVVLICSSTVL